MGGGPTPRRFGQRSLLSACLRFGRMHVINRSALKRRVPELFVNDLQVANRVDIALDVSNLLGIEGTCSPRPPMGAGGTDGWPDRRERTVCERRLRHPRQHTDDVEDGVNGANVRQERVAEPLALRGALHEASNVDDGEVRGHTRGWLVQLTKPVESLVRHGATCFRGV